MELKQNYLYRVHPNLTDLDITALRTNPLGDAIMHKERGLQVSFFMHNCFLKARMRTQFDKIAGSDFERPQDGPKGGGQDARSNPLGESNRFPLSRE